MITIPVTVGLEHFGAQFVRARALGPWKVQAVGATDAEALQRIQKKLAKALGKSLPSTYFQTNLPEEHETWITKIELKPVARSSAWQEPLQVELQSFRWLLEDGQAYVLVPAVACTLFGSQEELTDEEVATQAKVALNRLAQDRDLLELQYRFTSRSFRFQRLMIDVAAHAGANDQDKGKAERRKTSTLRSAASDLSNAPLPKVYGLDHKARELAECFQGEHPQSILLVGPAGVGKTALVHRLVRMRRDLGLENRKIWSTSGARIVSGMSGMGMWQERCSKMIKEAHQTHAILHLGSLFELMEAGKIDGSPGVASMVRQAVSRRRLVAIAECTAEQLAVVEREDPMLVRSFVRMDFEEPTSQWTSQVLTQAARDLYVNEPFSAGAIEELVRLHTRFATYSALPATALRLMRTMTKQETKETIEEKSAHDVARAFAKQSGLPRFLVDDSITLDLAKVREMLSRNVIGQAEPVELIVSLIATLKARLVRPGKPLASLMFIGPTGVGKTEMAKAIARLLYSDTKRMIRIDMSEFASPWSVSKLIGKPGEGDGALTSPIREQPFSVVLLDEFEKADANVFDLLLQVLGEGRLTDSQGQLADFRNAVVIMTSNLGAETFREDGFGFSGAAADWNEHFRRELQRFVRPEFLGRIDRIVPFQTLPLDIVRQIAQRELDLLQQRAGLKYSESELHIRSDAIDRLCELGYQPKYGARPLRRAIEEHVTVPLADKFGELASQAGAWRFEVTTTESKRIEISATLKRGQTDSVKEQEARVFDDWQRLGAMARCAQKSGPMRKLENEIERNQRQAEALRAKWKSEESLARKSGAHSRRAVKYKENLMRLEGEIEVGRKIQARLVEVIYEICQQQLAVNVAWHDNQQLDTERLHEERQTYFSLLRQSVEDVVKGRREGGDRICVMAIGDSHAGKRQLEILWRAYHLLAEENRWQLDNYILKPYDPLLDKESAEFRRRRSEKKPAMTELVAEPNSRMHCISDELGSIAPICDLFRYPSEDFAKNLEDAAGFVLQIQGTAAVNWFENEHGTYHFFDPNQAGAKRRQRIHVTVTSERFQEILLPATWREPSVDPSRDPRRTFNLQARTLNDIVLGIRNFAQGKESQTLFEMLQEEHEAALWRAIGFQFLPQAALLSKSESVYTVEDLAKS